MSKLSQSVYYWDVLLNFAPPNPNVAGMQLRAIVITLSSEFDGLPSPLYMGACIAGQPMQKQLFQKMYRRFKDKPHFFIDSIITINNTNADFINLVSKSYLGEAKVTEEQLNDIKSSIVGDINDF